MMKKHLFSCMCICFIIISIITLYFYKTTSARTREESPDEDVSTSLDYYTPNNSTIEENNRFTSWLDGTLKSGIVPSGIAGIIDGRRTLFVHGVHADRSTRYDIASLSKTFTAVLVLRLAQDGILSLDDPVIKYLPHVKIEREELNSTRVTIRHLMAHTSGLPSSGQRWTSYQLGSEHVEVPEQVNPAGYCYAYSNVGFVLVMHIIEKATGLTYDENIRRKILVPLEMNNTTAAHSNGTGGIISTFDDIAKYATMLIHRGRYKDRVILNQHNFDQMLSPTVEMPKTEVDYHYSLSWEVITVNGAVDSYYKAGRWFGGASGLQIFPGKGAALIYLCNPPNHQSESFMEWRQALTGKLRYLLRSVTNDSTLCSRWTTLTRDELQRYAGIYCDPVTGGRVTISLQGNTLFSNRMGTIQPLQAFSSNRFLLGGVRALHNFVWKDGRVIGVSFPDGFYRMLDNTYISRDEAKR